MSNPRSLRILLVEDHFSTRAALSLWLSALGHEVKAVETASAARGFAKDLLSTSCSRDLGLPDGDGRDLPHALREHHDFRAVAITGNSGPGEHELSRLAGFTQHLEKPVDLDELTVILRVAAEKRAEE